MKQKRADESYWILEGARSAFDLTGDYHPFGEYGTENDAERLAEDLSIIRSDFEKLMDDAQRTFEKVRTYKIADQLTTPSEAQKNEDLSPVLRLKIMAERKYFANRR